MPPSCLLCRSVEGMESVSLKPSHSEASGRHKSPVARHFVSWCPSSRPTLQRAWKDEEVTGRRVGSLSMVELGSKKLYSIQHASLPGRTISAMRARKRENPLHRHVSYPSFVTSVTRQPRTTQVPFPPPGLERERNGDPCAKLLALGHSVGHSVGKNEPRVQTWLPMTLVPNAVPPSPLFICPSMYVMLWAGHWALIGSSDLPSAGAGKGSTHAYRHDQILSP